MVLGEVLAYIKYGIDLIYLVLLPIRKCKNFRISILIDDISHLRFFGK